MILSICFKLTHNYFDAQDLTQDTFLSAYKNLSRFDGKNEKAWLSRIATNKCLDYLKRAARNTVATEDVFFQELPDKEASPERQVMDDILKEQLLTYCQNLDPPYDEVAIHYYYEEQSIRQIAEKLHRNEKTLRTQVYRAKGMLQRLYRKEGIR